MDFDFAKLPEMDRYRLLTNFVGPRPIALVTTIDEHGCNNAAPMSFFNVFSHEPPLLILGMQTRPDGTANDTVANIRRSGEFITRKPASRDKSISEHGRFDGVSRTGNLIGQISVGH